MLNHSTFIPSLSFYHNHMTYVYNKFSQRWQYLHRYKKLVKPPRTLLDKPCPLWDAVMRNLELSEVRNAVPGLGFTVQNWLKVFNKWREPSMWGLIEVIQKMENLYWQKEYITNDISDLGWWEVMAISNLQTSREVKKLKELKGTQWFDELHTMMKRVNL